MILFDLIDSHYYKKYICINIPGDSQKDQVERIASDIETVGLGRDRHASCGCGGDADPHANGCSSMAGVRRFSFV